MKHCEPLAWNLLSESRSNDTSIGRYFNGSASRSADWSWSRSLHLSTSRTHARDGVTWDVVQTSHARSGTTSPRSTNG